MSKNILFIGDGYPFGQNAGSILYKRIMEVYGIKNFCYFGIGSRDNKKWPVAFKDMPKTKVSLRLWPQIRGLKYLKKIPLIEELYYFIKIPLIQWKVNKFARKNEIEIIFILLRADVLGVANKINTGNKLKYLGYISDTVEAEYGDKNIIYRYKYAQYYKAIGKADAIYTASEAMDNYIKTNFNKKTAILRLGYENNCRNRSLIKTTKKEIKIFFAGSVYAKSEFGIFIEALKKLIEIKRDFNIILITATNYKVKSNHGGINIKELGWLDEKELISIMKASHIGYVPYKFDEKNRHQMSLAFPSKIGFYLSTGLPVFFHGPDYSSFMQFFEKYKCGVHCTSMDVDVIARQIEQVLFNEEVFSKIIKETRKAFENEFSLQVLEHNFRKLINDNTSS